MCDSFCRYFGSGSSAHACIILTLCGRIALGAPRQPAEGFVPAGLKI